MTHTHSFVKGSERGKHRLRNVSHSTHVKPCASLLIQVGWLIFTLFTLQQCLYVSLFAWLRICVNPGLCVCVSSAVFPHVSHVRVEGRQEAIGQLAGTRLCVRSRVLSFRHRRHGLTDEGVWGGWAAAANHTAAWATPDLYIPPSQSAACSLVISFEGNVRGFRGEHAWCFLPRAAANSVRVPGKHSSLH